MKYYIVKYETNNKIVGVGTQIQNCDPFGPSPYFDVPLNGPIDFGIEFPTFFMEDRAKRIDFVNCA